LDAIERTREEQQEQEAQKEIHVHVEEIELYRSTLKKKFAEKNVNWPSLSPYQVKPKLVK
jgi:hypothetical protein